MYDINVINEEFKKNKNFLESYYLLRNDYDIKFENLTMSENNKIPAFFEDIDYFLSIFSNIEEENLIKFFDDIL